MALVRDHSYPCPNYSSRGGAKVRLIVLHTAEGATTYQSLGNFFINSASTSNPTSSHVGIDNTPNTVGEYVDRGYKAWTAANANPVAVQAEMCAFAAWTTAQWNQNQVMLQNTAQWIAEEAKAFGIPIVKLSPQQAQSNGVGICQHRDLGNWGGNHSDCGNGFPIDSVISMAAGGSQPIPDLEEIEMIMIQAQSGWMSMFDGSTKTGLLDPNQANAFAAAGVKTVKVSDAQYNNIPTSK